MLKQLALAAALVLPTAALACDEDGHAQFKQMSVQEVAAVQQSGKATLVDANEIKTRTKYGTIPGAVLLTSSSSFEVAKELPGDKNVPLVFYCSSVRCTAAPGAAKRAIEAGYTNVAVMPEGITGWVKAGQPVNRLPATGAAAQKS